MVGTEQRSLQQLSPQQLSLQSEAQIGIFFNKRVFFFSQTDVSPLKMKKTILPWLPVIVLLYGIYHFHTIRQIHPGILPSYLLLFLPVFSLLKPMILYRNYFSTLQVYKINLAIGTWLCARSVSDLAIDHIWDYYPSIPINNRLILYYAWMLTYSIVSMLREKPALSTLWLHHVITIGLLVISYQLNYMRIGTWVLLTHGITEPFVQGARDYKSSIIYPVGLLLSWFICRILIFGFILYPRCVFIRDTTVPYDLHFGYYALNCLMTGLLLLNCTWFILICRKAIKKFT